jgi:hypothetical protein
MLVMSQRFEELEEYVMSRLRSTPSPSASLAKIPLP